MRGTAVWERVEGQRLRRRYSFDNYLGTLRRGQGFPLGGDGQPDAENPDASGQAVRAYHLLSTVQHSGVRCQSWRAAHAQFAGGKMTGFVTATQAASSVADTSVAMGYWMEADLPLYHGLAADKADGALADMVRLLEDGARPDGSRHGAAGGGGPTPR